MTDKNPDISTTIESLRDQAAKVFGSAEKGDEYLNRHALYLGRSPNAVIKEEGIEGIKKVSTLLMQLQYGVYP